jgi:hypothetical protein
VDDVPTLRVPFGVRHSMPANLGGIARVHRDQSAIGSR